MKTNPKVEPERHPFLYRLLWVAFVCTLVFGADYLLGFFNDTGRVRESARLFREEVAPLQIHTLNLVPNLKHTYVDAERPVGEILVPEGANRRLNTDSTGLILNGNQTEAEGREGRFSPAKTILFLGGSTTECNEVDQPFRFPAVVEKLLRGAGATIRTENGGVRGHTSQDSINALLNRRDFRDADIIVLMQNINDRARLAAGLHYAVRLGTVAPATTKAVDVSFWELCSNILDWLSYRSNIVFIVREAASHLDPWVGTRDIVIDNNAIEPHDLRLDSHAVEFEKNLKIFVSIVRILGKTPVLMTQPLGVDSVGEKRFNAMIRDVAATEAVQLVDLEAALGPHPQWAFLRDNIHMNNVGSAAVGAIIACQLNKTVIHAAKGVNLHDLFSKGPPFNLTNCSIEN
jgi:lysophospholipase L1-like esterase